MKAEKLMNAIGNISDRHIEEFAEVKPVHSSKTLWLGAVSIAACLAIIFGITANSIGRPTTDDAPNVQACIVGDDYYELIYDEEKLEAKGLTLNITEDMVGNYIGTCTLESDGRIGKAYDYLGYNGSSVLILKLESNYYYLFFCNLTNNSVAMPMSELLEMYGLKDNISDITVDGDDIINKGCDIGTVTNELSNAAALSGVEFEPAVFNGKTEEEQQLMIGSLTSVEIAISGDSADTLVLNYYPSLGYAYSANCYYKFTPELINILG
jgi:hypothetical protein